MSVGREQVLEALRAVLDPELGVSITMTLTSQRCPLHGTLVEWVRRAVSEVPGVDTVQVAVTFDPLWTPHRIGRAPSR